MNAPHQHRQARTKRVRVAAMPAVIYAPGFFMEPVRAWKQLQFVSQLFIDPATRRFASEFQIAKVHRSGRGFDTHPLNLPGAMTEPLRSER